MEQTQTSENPPKEPKQDLTVPLMISTFLACAWLVYVFVNQSWLDALDKVVAWILNPTITYTSMSIAGVPWALLATIAVLVLGFLWANLLLGDEKDTTIKLVTAIGMGFGLTGLVTIILGIVGKLYQAPLNIGILVVGAVSLAGLLYRRRFRQKLSLRECLTPHFSLHFQFKRPPNLKFWLPAAAAIAIIFFFSFYFALLTVIVHWDAAVYHAAMAAMMYNDNAIPVLAGTSIGIEMSANFPPLFSALGAFYYIQIGTIEDFFLRAIPPVMGLLTVLATYKIGEVIHGRKLGVLAALFLTLTPLFFRYSIYATSYSTLTFFCTMAVLFVLLGIVIGNMKYWVASGVFLGFATLTSYIALYLAPFFLLALVYQFLKHRGAFKLNMKKVAVFLLAVVLVGGIWYARNEIVVGNPIYPNAYTVLGGVNIDPLIMNATVNGIKNSAAISYFGESNATVFDQVMTFLTYRTSFPAISLFTVLAVVLLPTMDKKYWLLAVWPLSLSALVLSGISWGFPRHMLFAMPGFALLSALPLIKALDICKQWDKETTEKRLRQFQQRLPSLRKSNIIRIGVIAILLGAFIFPSLTLVMGGKGCEENLADQVPKDYMWFLEHPNADTWTVLNRLYPEAQAWEYINANLAAGQKVAAVENRIYYVKNCSNDYFFYLDGWEARDLYNITDPTLMVQFLRDNNVTIVVDVQWARDHGHFNILPMTQYLGSPSPYFPTIYNNNSNPAIYNVGPFYSPLTNDSEPTVSLSYTGWSQIKSIGGVLTQSVTAGNDSAKLYVATPNATYLNVTYLDVGNDTVSVNLHEPKTQEWKNGFTVIQKTNTGTWKTFQFIVPIGDKGCVEFGFHSFKEDFVVSKIKAAPYTSQARPFFGSPNCAINGTLSMQLTNTTVPPALMVYLPIENGTQKIQVQTNSYGKQVCIEVFDGIIQPWENTDWWTRLSLIARSPASIVYGACNSSITWTPDNSTSCCTLIIVLRQPWDPNVKVDLTITTEVDT